MRLNCGRMREIILLGVILLLNLFSWLLLINFINSFIFLILTLQLFFMLTLPSTLFALYSPLFTLLPTLFTLHYHHWLIILLQLWLVHMLDLCQVRPNVKWHPCIYVYNKSIKDLGLSIGDTIRVFTKY